MQDIYHHLFFPCSSDMYVHDIKSGITVSDREPSITKETAATALVDGANVLGPVVGNFSMKTAISKAQQTGVGWVVANGRVEMCFLDICCFFN